MKTWGQENHSNQGGNYANECNSEIIQNKESKEDNQHTGNKQNTIPSVQLLKLLTFQFQFLFCFIHEIHYSSIHSGGISFISANGLPSNYLTILYHIISGIKGKGQEAAYLRHIIGLTFYFSLSGSIYLTDAAK